MDQPDTAALEARRKRNRENFRRHHARMLQLTRLEQVAFAHRKEIGKADPYSPEERIWADDIQVRIGDLQRDAEALGKAIMARLEASGSPADLILAKGLSEAKTLRVELSPF